MANLNEKKQYHFIYKTINLINGKYYVGMHSTSNLKDNYLGSGTRLRHSIRKYGAKNFKLEILEWHESRESLSKREKELVNEDLIKDELCMNLKFGGIGGGRLWNEDHRKKFIDAGLQKRKWLWENDKEWANKNRETLSNNSKMNYKMGKCKNWKYDWTGKKHTPETIEKMRVSNKKHGKGETNSQYGTCWITNGTENKKIKKDELLPDGWALGRIYRKKDN